MAYCEKADGWCSLIDSCEELGKQLKAKDKKIEWLKADLQRALRDVEIFEELANKENS